MLPTYPSKSVQRGLITALAALLVTGCATLNGPETQTAPVSTEAAEEPADVIFVNPPADQTEEVFESVIESMPIAEVYAWELTENLQSIQKDWEKAHEGGKWSNLKVVDFLSWKDDPLIKKLFNEWKEQNPTEVANHLYIERLAQFAVKAQKERKIDVLRDIRPDYLLGYTNETRDEEKINDAPGNPPAFP